jgi:hypothetical protein
MLLQGRPSPMTNWLDHLVFVEVGTFSIAEEEVFILNYFRH